jgi:hypothetical protein
MSPFFSFRNSLDANQNLYWSVSSTDLYTRLDLRRRLLYKILVDSETKNFSDGTFEITPEGLKLLSLSGVKYITSPGPIRNQAILKLKEILITKDETPFWLYQNPTPFPHAYLTRDYVVVKNLSSYTGRLLKNPDSKTAVLESEIDLLPDHDDIIPVKVIMNDNNTIKLEVSPKKKSLLILSDTFFPDWKATIDGQETAIYPVNINERTVLVKPGKHTVEFDYIPLRGVFKKML